MSECKQCGKVLNYAKEGFATTLNNEVVLMCEECYLKNCAVINSNYEKDENYKVPEDLPIDVLERLRKINYPVKKFLEAVVYDSEPSMLQWLYCMESNAHKQPKEFEDLANKIKKVEHHPSLNEYQVLRIEAYLKANLSIRDVVKALKADNIETSYGTVKSVRKKLKQEGVI